MAYTRRPSSVLAVALLLSVAPFFSPWEGTAATWVWPSFDCFQTLQQCVDFAAPGDVVEVASQGPIQESLTIDGKSLTLRPHSGFVPVFAAPHYIFVLGGSAHVDVTIQGMTLTTGRLILRHAGAGVFDVRVRDNTILDAYTSASAIEVTSTNSLPAYGPVFFEVSGNRIHIRGTPSTSYLNAIVVGGFLSSARGKIAGNTILHTGVAATGAVIRVVGGARSTTVDVVSNEIRGVFDTGISLQQATTGGKLGTRVINNLVVGQVGGAGAGIFVDCSGGSTTAYVVNNTVAGGERGIQIFGHVEAGARLSGHLANNVVVGHRNSGVTIEPGIQTTFTNERNLVFRNVTESFTPGPGTLFVDPLFASANDFRLTATSPAKDAGANARVPADITLDLAGLPRIQGAAVAMGAYEN